MYSRNVSAVWHAFATRASQRIMIIVLLAVALGSLLLLQDRSNGFDSRIHGILSAHGMTIGKSIVASGRLLMYTSQSWENNHVIYDGYNRFPIFPFLLIGLVTLPFEPHLAAQIFAARELMNLFFAGAIVMVFLAIRELTGSAWRALVASMLACSTSYMLRYNDMIFNDTPALVGFALACYLVVRGYKQNLSVRRIVTAAVVSVTVGWQALAVYIAWMVVDGLARLRSGKVSMASVRQFIQGTPFKAFSAALVTILVILTLQILNEWRSVGGSLMALPTIQSAVSRAGFAEAERYGAEAAMVEWKNFLPEQGLRVIRMSLPLYGMVSVNIYPTLYTLLIVGIIGMILVGGLIVYRKQLIAPVGLIWAISGIFWAIPFKNFVAFHDFQSTYYVGFGMALFTIVALALNSKAVPIAAIILCLLFVGTVRRANLFKGETGEYASSTTGELQAIYDRLPRGSKVYLDGDPSAVPDGVPGHSIDLIMVRNYYTTREQAEFVISANPSFNARRITNNSRVNLFKSNAQAVNPNSGSVTTP